MANGDVVWQLVHCQRAGLEWHEELETICQQTGLRGRKLAKVTSGLLSLCLCVCVYACVCLFVCVWVSVCVSVCVWVSV